ncbi:D-xylose ABC transporter ATP-binding protein [Nibricoccus aquaticus]|uniref:D-xylose ABC transporter ATP-binding protein n=1 Tax=Nibricoccus aquaticus TaxID=2576891 RepID=A0A290QL01_9BACT|nr:D-xylose ABC transporter ATP-binding protein [Nibricoccus aquaticus]
MTASTDVLLEATGITITFPGVRALDGVSIRVRAGRLLALLGENGAGKSTLMNVLSGVFPPDAGTISLGNGESVRFASPHAAQTRGIGIVHQELNLVPGLNVAENIWLGREPRTSAGFIDYRRLNADTAAILARLDLKVSPVTLVGDLRVGQQQLVEIGKALSANARVLILDEPTSSLSAHEVEVLFNVIAELKKQHVGLVYITHKFEELARLCDDVVIMRDGRVVGEIPYEGLTRERIVQLMAGRESKDVFQKSSFEPGAELLKIENLSLAGSTSGSTGRRLLVNNVSLTLRRREVLGIFGLVGAGRTEFLETIFGLHPGRTNGNISVGGKPASFRSPADAIRAGLALAPEDRKRDGLILPMSVAANASLASLRRTLRGGFVSRRKESDYLIPYVDRFRVKTPSLDQLIVNLSGGNQQKVILAKWLATDPKIMLLDEPTRGIDVNAKREIYAFIDELARNGLGLIVVSSELPEVLALSDRILVMCEGRKTAEFTRAEATPERVLHAALPDRAALAS